MDAQQAGDALGTAQATEHLERYGNAWATGQALRDYAVGDWFSKGRAMTGDTDAGSFIAAYERAYRRRAGRIP